MTSTPHETLLAEARLSSPPASRLTKHYALPGLERERRQFHEFVAVDLAHTTMLVEQGILSAETGRAILEQLLIIRRMQPSAFPVDVRKGSLLLQIESYLFGVIGEDVGGQMHTGRSRIDQGATVRRLYKRNRMLDVMDQLNVFQEAIAEQARRHAHTIMPGYTHMQQAQPWVFGHYLLSFSSRLHDSFERLAQAYGRVNRNPLGTVGLPARHGRLIASEPRNCSDSTAKSRTQAWPRSFRCSGCDLRTVVHHGRFERSGYRPAYLVQCRVRIG
jgi:argininosuccinate lyase